MESRKAVLELKDVPPPPPHHTSSQSPQPFSLAPLPLPPPCLPPPQLTQDSHQQQSPVSQQQQEGASPKVSICTHCDYCDRDSYGLLGGRGVVSSSSSLAGVVSLYMDQGSSAVGSTSSNIGTSGPCSVDRYKHNLTCGSEAHNPLLNLGCKSYLPSSVATSQPVSSHPYLPCCSGLLHTYPTVCLPFSQPSLLTSSAPLASLPSVASLPAVSSLPGPMYGSCLASSRCYTCSVDSNPLARGPQRSTLGDHPTSTTVTTTTTSAHFCSNPLHLNVKHTVMVKGAHYCQECLLKVGYSSVTVECFFCAIISLYM